MRADETARLDTAVPGDWCPLSLCAIHRAPFGPSGGLPPRDSILLPVLAIPTLRARVKRDVHRRAVSLAPHVHSAPISSLPPRNLRFARGKGIADFVGNLLRKRRIRVN